MAQPKMSVSRRKPAGWKKYKLPLAAGGSAILLLILFLIFWRPGLSPGSKAEPDSGAPSAQAKAGGTEGVVLPVTERDLEETGSEIKDNSAGTRDPFSLMELKGIVTGSDGNSLAVIQTGESAIIVRKGTIVAGQWKTKQINDNSVVLVSETQALELGFGGTVSTREINDDSTESEKGDGEGGQ